MFVAFAMPFSSGMYARAIHFPLIFFSLTGLLPASLQRMMFAA